MQCMGGDEGLWLTTTVVMRGFTVVLEVKTSGVEMMMMIPVLYKQARF